MITQPDPCAACGADPGGGGKKKSHPCKFVPKGAKLSEARFAKIPLLVFHCARCGYWWTKRTELSPDSQLVPL